MNKNKFFKTIMIVSMIAPNISSVMVVAQEQEDSAVVEHSVSVSAGESGLSVDSENTVVEIEETQELSSNTSEEPQQESQQEQISAVDPQLDHLLVPVQEQSNLSHVHIEDYTDSKEHIPLEQSVQSPGIEYFGNQWLDVGTYASKEDMLYSNPSSVDDLNEIKPAYVDHWSGKDAYTHNLLSRRYGIQSDQIDGFLKSTGIDYDKSRINGEKLLKWEKESGLDVRAIVAIAISESSLGTQVAKNSKNTNMFGYVPSDMDFAKTRELTDEEALINMTKENIIRNNNVNFAIQDSKAAKLASGNLDIENEGNVFFTDTTGSGKRRAKIMEDMDKWIDLHGGTPIIPKAIQQASSSRFEKVPIGYTVSKSYDVISYEASSYSWGQCTWYVYNRAKELGYQFDPYMGNGGNWKYKPGYDVSNTPKVGSAICFSPGEEGADSLYGHIAIVEEIRKDGSILISESNCIGLGDISYRVFSAEQAQLLTYVLGEIIDSSLK